MLKPISQELGLSRAAASIPASIGRLEGGFMSLLAGWITDKFGPRGLILTGVLLTSLSLALICGAILLGFSSRLGGYAGDRN